MHVGYFGRRHLVFKLANVKTFFLSSYIDFFFIILSLNFLRKDLTDCHLVKKVLKQDKLFSLASFVAFSTSFLHNFKRLKYGVFIYIRIRFGRTS